MIIHYYSDIHCICDTSNDCTCRNKTCGIFYGCRDVSCCYSRFVDQRMNNKNTEVVDINIYSRYLQQNGELVLNISVERQATFK